MQRRHSIAIAIAIAIVGFGTAGTAHADKPVGVCPSDKWQESVFPLDWQPDDPIDPNGENLLFQIGVAGIIEEFGSLEAGLAAFGFSTLTEFYAAAIDPAYNKVDRNDDGVLCAKPHPDTSGAPAYLANAVDNTASH
jgi:hypothetical protein